MGKILGARAKAFIINQTSRFHGDSDSVSASRESQKDEAGNDLPADEEGDHGITYRANKRRKTHDPNEMMVEVFEEK
jgi:hypothetical protein